MAMDVGGAKGGLKADINVTPLVDVMLVLLIIMMLVAPMLQKGVDVKLPQATNTVDKPDTQEQTVVHITAASRPTAIVPSTRTPGCSGIWYSLPSPALIVMDRPGV